jgi:hypothetical protein
MPPSIYDWSTTPGSNSSADGAINWAEGQDPGTVNDSARQMMGRIAEFVGDINGSLSAGGTANGLTVTANSAFTTYANGRILAFKATADNTTAATLNVNGIGAKAIRKMDSTGDVDLAGGEIQDTGIYLVQYSTALNGGAGAWLLVNSSIPTISVTVQTFTANGTWTKPTGCRRAIFEAVGGGGGSGSVQGTAGSSAGATGGGGSAFSGKTGTVNVESISSAAVTIGAAGTAGSAGGAGGNGGNTAITIGATTYTWGGGSGSPGFNSNTSTSASTQPGTGGTGTNVDGHSEAGTMGVLSSLDQNAQGGVGGSSAFGRGGRGAFRNSAGVSSGDAATGYGAGGGGSVLLTSVSSAAGTAGSAGFMRVWEFY